jgi:hypothetical protein
MTAVTSEITITSRRAATGQHVLGKRGGGGGDVAVAARQTRDQGGGGFGHAVIEGGVVGVKNLGHAGELGGLGRCCGGGACDQEMHVAQRRHGGEGLCHGIGGELPVIHIGEKKNGHQITPASSLSFAISS